MMKKIKRVKHLAKKAIFTYNREGFSGLWKAFGRYRRFIRNSTPERRSAILDGKSAINDFVKLYNPTVKNEFIPMSLDKDKKLVINWIVPDFKTASGGHLNIFRMIKNLEKLGHKNRIYLFDVGTGLSYKNGDEAKKAIAKGFSDIEADVFLGVDNMKDSDVVFATSWHTAYPAYTVRNTKQKFYFIQDYEPMFYSVSSEHFFAEQTYKMGFKCITAGPWLSRIMREKYDAPAEHYWLAYDRNIYKPSSFQKNGKTVAFCGRFVTPRRGFEVGIMALEIVKKKRPDTDIIIFGWDTSNQAIPFKHKSIGSLTYNQLADLYEESDIGVVFSMTNYSLIPQEMMGSSLPVVEFKGDNTEQIFVDNENILLAEPNPYIVAEKIIYLLDNPEERKRISRNAFEWVNKFSWNDSAKIVERALYEL